MTKDTDKIEIASLDYDAKVKLLEKIAQEILNIKVDFAHVSGEYARMRAEMQVLKEVKSALQSALRAEQAQ